MKHLSHLLLLGKGFILIAGLVIFALSGSSSELGAALTDRFSGSMWAVVPLFWLMLGAGGLLLTFPLSLIDEHYTRVRQQEPEETPVWHWLQFFAIELVIILLVGSVTTTIMHVRPALWWLYLTVLWLAYHAVMPILQNMTLLASVDDDQQEQHPELIQELKSALAAIGIQLKEARLLPDEEEHPHLEQDIYIASRSKVTTLFLPPSWVAWWSIQEITAATLHKAIMHRADIVREQSLLRLIQSLLCFGTFAMCFPTLRAWAWVSEPGHITTAPWLAAWVIAMAGLLRPLEFALMKRWIFRADDAVVALMRDKAAIISALERAREDQPDEAVEHARWVEIILMPVPSISQRLSRLRGS